MSTIVERAVSRQRKAMQYLYDANKQKSYYIAYTLLADEAQATDAVTSVFRTIWSSISSSGDTSEAGFSQLVIQKTVDYCKKKTTNKDPKALRMPAGKDFSLLSSPRSRSDEESVLPFVLEHFSILQRFLFILHTVGDYSNVALSRTLQLDLKTIGTALDAEQNNINRLLQAASCDTCRTREELIAAVIEEASCTRVPDEADQAVVSIIDQLAAPGEQKRKKTTIILSLLVIAVCLCTATAFLIHTLRTQWKAQKAEASALDPTLTYYADIEIANYGRITFRLEQEAAPITAANFVALAESGFYDGLTFHRIMEGFMMQGGDPNGNGSGGSGQTIVGEFAQNGYSNPLSHTRGAVSMARANDPNSASSQFFIMHKDNPGSLDGKYAVFGYVTEGMDVVDQICESAEPTDNNGTIPAANQPVITSITIRTE